MDTRIAPGYIKANFHREDPIAIVIIRKSTHTVEQRVDLAGKIVSDSYQRWLRHINANPSRGVCVHEHDARGRNQTH